MLRNHKFHVIALVLTILLTLALSTTACRTPQASPPANSDQEVSETLPTEQHTKSETKLPHLPEPKDCRTTGCDGDGVCVQRDQIDCRTLDYCQSIGACSLVPQDQNPLFGEFLCTNWTVYLCGPMSEDDCLQSTICKEEGHCTQGNYQVRTNLCGETSDLQADCLHNKACLPTESACQKSTDCATLGNCGLQTTPSKSNCRPTEVAHCAQSEICKTDNKCFLSQNRCVIEDDIAP